MEFSTDPHQIIETVTAGSLTLSEAIERFEISEIIRRFGQWVVTEKGIESLVIEYAITKNRLTETDWASHMSEKMWVVIDEFEAAFQFAKEYYFVEPEIMPEITIPLNGSNLNPIVDYFTAKKLYQSLIAIHEAYNASERYIPNNIPRPENAPASFSVKDDFILSPIYSGFASLLHGFLACTAREYLLEQFQTETLLNFTSKQFRHLLIQILNQAYKNGF
jgi:hypothetical protein